MTPTKKSPKSAKTSGMLRDRTPLELSVLAASLLAIASIMVALIMSEARTATGPADLRVTVGEAGAPRSGGVPYEVRVHNAGGETAENVEIEVTVGSETRTLQLTTVMRGEDATGVVIFPPATTGAARAEVQASSEPAA